MGAMMSSWFVSQVDVSHIDIDFHNPPSSPAQASLSNEAEELLTLGWAILARLEAYQDVSAAIKPALADASLEPVAFKAVQVNIEHTYAFYTHALAISELFPRILASLAASDDETTSITDQQVIAKRLAELLDFVLRFDELKMNRPGLTNDFAFYKRSLAKHREEAVGVTEENAAMVSMFLAQSAPMMSYCITSVSDLMKESELVGKIPRVIATIANVCHHLVNTDRFEDRDTVMLCLRAMVGSIIIFDYVTEEGAFVKRSGINVSFLAKSSSLIGIVR